MDDLEAKMNRAAELAALFGWTLVCSFEIKNGEQRFIVCGVDGDEREQFGEGSSAEEAYSRAISRLEDKNVETMRAIAEDSAVCERYSALTQIAHEHLGMKTLETRRANSLDFHDVAVWNVRAALEAAYDAGVAALMRKSEKKDGRNADLK